MDQNLAVEVTKALMEGATADEAMLELLCHAFDTMPAVTAYPPAKLLAIVGTLRLVYQDARELWSRVPDPDLRAQSFGLQMLLLGFRCGQLQEQARKMKEERRVNSGQQGQQEAGSTQPGEAGPGRGPQGTG